MATNVAPTGMYFTITNTGALVPQTFTDMQGGGYGNNEAPFGGDWQICVTGVPGGVLPTTIAPLITQYVSIPLPFANLHWKVTYASLGAPVVATPW